MTGHDLIIIVGLLIGGALALAGLFRPFLGLLLLITIHFMQPGELIPALAPFRLEFVYGILVILSFILHRASGSSRPLFSHRIFIAALILLGVATLSIPFAIWRFGALDQTITLTKLVVFLFLIGTLVDTNERMRTVVWLLVGLLVWYAGSALSAYLRGEFVFAQGIERAVGRTSEVGGPNELAGLIVALLPFLVVAFRTSRKILVKALLLPVCPLALAAVVVTGSRSGMLNGAAIAGFYVLMSKHKVVSFVMVAVMAVGLWLAMPPQYQQRYLTMRDYATGGQLDASNEFRLRVWKAGWRMFLDHPILGVGAGQFPTAYGTVYSGRAHGAWMNPHNLIIQVGCELGLIGLFVFGYFMSQIVKANYSQLRLKGQAGYELNYEVAVACGAFLLGLAVASTFGHTLYRPYWYLLGGLVVANGLTADKIEKTQVRPSAEEVKVANGEREARFVTQTYQMRGRM